MPRELTIDQAVSEALKAVKQGNLIAARKLFEAVLKARPDHASARDGLNRLIKVTDPPEHQVRDLMTLYRSGRLADAEQACRQLQASHDQSLFVTNLLGAVLQAQGKFRDALTAFERAIQIQPVYAQAHNNRGVALKALGRFQEAVESYAEAARLKPDYAEAYCNQGNAFQAQGQPEKAVAAFDKAIKIKPDYPDALMNRGNAFKDLGLQAEAQKNYKAAIKIRPDFAPAHNNLGALLNDMEQTQAALKAFEKAIRLNPDYAEAYNNRGAALQKSGQLKAALESFDRAVEINPQYAQAFTNRGNVLMKLNRFDAAVESHQKALRIRPDFEEALNNLGNAFQEMGQIGKAVNQFKKAIRLKPDYASAHNNLGFTLQELGDPQGALKAYDNAVRFNPDFADAYNNRGNAWMSTGDIKAALDNYTTAIRIKPDYAEAFNNRGIALKSMGRTEAARQSYKEAIRLKPDYAQAYRNLSNIQPFSPGASLIKQMDALIQGNDLSDDQQMHLHFAMGKALEDTGDVAGAFRHLKAGNRFRKQAFNYHISSDKKLFNRIKEAFSNADPDLIVQESEISAHRPIFILGMPRSGTTLVEQILASHSKVYGAGELKLLGKTLAGSPLSRLSPDRVSGIRSRYLNGLNELHREEPCITDKMPLNFRWIGFIITALPEARIVHVKRNATATCWSVFKHFFSENGNEYAYDLEDVAEYYRLYTDLMRFWHEQFPGKIYDLGYETLTESQKSETQKLLDYCGLDWEDTCLEFYDTQRAVKTASALQVRKKMYQGSSEGWKKFKPYMNPMLRILEKEPCNCD